ncbi:hypothetical protein [Lewinella sp. W8]|uniref:hypothetical protein n=1 Tax=Lewinella sp. W8 TaxID=2528208 RepID=UPI001067F9BF|nr:hypothetical protein [Lewinella sp. W8]MTB51746.1 hypothetical protein [Lewinella sp. W8]
MKQKLYLLTLLIAALFTSCLEEENSMVGTFEIGEPSAAVLTGTGLPKTVVLQSVTFSTKKGDEVTRNLPHVDMEFSNCGGEWCQSLVNDCGIASRMQFSFEETEEGLKSMSFDAYSRVPSVAVWAYPGKFAFDRTGANLTLHCSDCPGNINGFEYEQRTVSMRVVR